MKRKIFETINKIELYIAHFLFLTIHIDLYDSILNMIIEWRNHNFVNSIYSTRNSYYNHYDTTSNSVFHPNKTITLTKYTQINNELKTKYKLRNIFITNNFIPSSAFVFEFF